MYVLGLKHWPELNQKALNRIVRCQPFPEFPPVCIVGKPPKVRELAQRPGVAEKIADEIFLTTGGLRTGQPISV